VKVGAIPSRDDLTAVSVALKKATLFAGDFEQCMQKTQAGDFAYLDPPYTTCDRVPRGEYGYESFSNNDLDRLVRCLTAANRRGVRILLSYRSEPSLKRALPSWCFRKLQVKRHVAGFAKHRATTTEVLAANYELPKQRTLD
jgi:DNA adenine methylase